MLPFSWNTLFRRESRGQHNRRRSVAPSSVRQRRNGPYASPAGTLRHDDICSSLAFRYTAGFQGPDPIGLRAAVAAHLARYKGMSRSHTDADPRVYLAPRAPIIFWIHSLPGGWTRSCTCGGCKRPPARRVGAPAAGAPPVPAGRASMCSCDRSCPGLVAFRTLARSPPMRYSISGYRRCMSLSNSVKPARD